MVLYGLHILVGRTVTDQRPINKLESVSWLSRHHFCGSNQLLAQYKARKLISIACSSICAHPCLFLIELLNFEYF